MLEQRQHLLNYCVKSYIYLAGQRATNWEHNLYHSKVDGDLSHDRQTHTNTEVSEGLWLTSLFEKTRKSNHLEILEQRQYLLSYFKTLSVGPAGNRTQAPRIVNRCLADQANQAARHFQRTNGKTYEHSHQ